MSAKILVVDDETTFRDVLANVLLHEGFEVVNADDGEGALRCIQESDFDVIICDIRMPGVDGIEVLTKTLEISPQTLVMMVTAYGDVESAVEAMKRGASDYITKPVVFEDIIMRVQHLLEYRELALENQFFRQELEQKYNFHNIVGDSEVMKGVYSLVQKISSTRSTVLITGESGTGKELIARAIHYNSPRKEKRFVPLNCSAIPESLLESELFGHIKGSFTGAMSTKKGLFEVANDGTLFLDEISAMPSATQAKLLRVLESQEITAVGATDPVKVDVRIISATNRELAEAVETNVFREDLFYRLNVMEIKLPSLRQRKDDIPKLARHFVSKYNKELKKNCRGLGNSAMKALLKYEWKGNVRELENVLERAMILAEGDFITLSDLPPNLSELSNHNDEMGDKRSLKRAARQFERDHILQVLEETHNNKAEAAKILGISLSSLYRKIEEASGLESTP